MEDSNPDNGHADVMPGGVPRDIAMYRSVIDDKLKVFIERREQYGSHLDNAARFPMEHISGLYVKLCRAIRDIESRGEVKPDTLLDLSNYCDILLSSSKAEDDE